jgi:putative sterol carrier protein
MNEQDDKLDWHTAFRNAIELEFITYNDILSFEFEHKLNAQPLIIDALIIKKKPNAVITKNIGKIFRGVNVIEYKSPSDYISIRSFFKSCVYVGLYIALNPTVKPNDITLTVIDSRHPREVIEFLVATGHAVNEVENGIYEVTNLLFPTQVIESQKLSERENMWLRNLRSDINAEKAETILNKLQKDSLADKAAAYLDILVRANPDAFMEVINMKYPTMEEVLEKTKPFQELKAQNARYQAQNAQYQAQNAQYQAQNARYQAQNAQYQTQIAELQRQLAEARIGR